MATGLLSALSQYLRDAAPGGSLNPEVTPQGLLDAAAIATMPAPIVGDAVGLLADINRYRTQPSERTALNYGLTGLGLLPFFPGFGTIKQMMPDQSFVRKATSQASKPLLEQAAKAATPEVKRVVNPKYWKSDVGGAAWHLGDDAFTGVHVTGNPQKVRGVLESGTPLRSAYGSDRNAELGGGLYFSARPEAWSNRAIEGDRFDVPVKAKGNFVVVDRPLKESEVKKLQDAGFAGAMIPGGMGGVMQTVVWDNDAVRQFGEFAR